MTGTSAPLSIDQAVARARAGIAALQAGRTAEAREAFAAVAAAGRANVQVWLLLATACRTLGDSAGEEAALDALLGLEPGLVRALVMKGTCRARAGDERAALSFYEIALRQAEGAEIPPDLAAELDAARRYVAAAGVAAEARREAALVAAGLGAGERSAAFAQSLEIMAGRKAIFVQQPTGYYWPGLPQVQFFDPAEFEWAAAVEAASGAILAELQALLAGPRDLFRPYLHGSGEARLSMGDMVNNADWSALFLCENGAENAAAIAACPATWAALSAVPQPRTSNGPTTMFSLLRGGARIAPHTGMFNTRLICHLPLVVPPDCHFRVGNEVRQWEAGKLLVFDDTIEHEAWNDSGDERVVLIFDIWRPELNALEREEVSALFAATGLVGSA